MGAFGGILILVGLVFTFIGHRHMGEGPSYNYRGAPVYPIETFIVGLVLMGVGLIIGISALVNGVDDGAMHYSDFFPGSSN